jgi:hypothetical protein
MSLIEGIGKRPNAYIAIKLCEVPDHPGGTGEFPFLP